MKKTKIKNKHHRVLAFIDIDVRGVHRISDQHHRLLGFYDPRTNRTSDRHHRIVGYGYLLPKLITSDLAEEGEAGHIKPLTPEQNRKEMQRKVALQRKANDERQRHAAKMRDLAARAQSKP